MCASERASVVWKFLPVYQLCRKCGLVGGGMVHFGACGKLLLAERQSCVVGDLNKCGPVLGSDRACLPF